MTQLLFIAFLAGTISDTVASSGFEFIFVPQPKASDGKCQ